MLCLWAFVSCLSQMFCLDRKNAGNPITDYRRIFYVFFDNAQRGDHKRSPLKICIGGNKEKVFYPLA